MMVNRFHRSMHWIAPTLVALFALYSCEGQVSELRYEELDCDEVYLNEFNDTLMYKVCDALDQLEIVHDRTKGDTSVTLFMSTEYPIREEYRNLRNQYLLFQTFVNGSRVFSIERNPGFMRDSTLEKVEGSPIVSIGISDSDSLFVRRYFLSYPMMVDHVAIDVWYRDDLLNQDVLWVDSRSLPKRLNQVELPKELSLFWTLSIELHLNSGRVYQFEHRVE